MIEKEFLYHYMKLEIITIFFSYYKNINKYDNSKSWKANTFKKTLYR